MGKTINKGEKLHMNKYIKYASSITGLVLASISLTSCSDYGYEFHFAVINGNGNLTVHHPTIDIENLNIEFCSEVPYHKNHCPEGSHVFYMMGGKSGSFEFTFIAEPNEGYEVKQWLFNNDIVVDNTTNSFLAKVSRNTSYQGFIAVEFEPIVE